MPIDASIYQNIQPIPVNLPDPVHMVDSAMKMRDLGIQLQTQQAVRQAYAANTDPQSGQLNQQGFLSTLGKAAPYAVPQFQQQFAALNKQQAEAQAAKLDAAQKTLGVTGPAWEYLAGLPEDQRASAYSSVLKQVGDQGVDTSHMPTQYDPGFFRQTYSVWQKSKPALENFLTQSSIAKNWAEAGPMAAAKLNAELYGSSSPNAELTSQYDKQAAPIRSSQLAMNQMLDNYKNPSPQGDASLVLNAFKIKFPTAPDVNSLKELGESQATVDQWKNLFAKAAQGGVDQPTRDNLLRDAVSTFRGNVDSLRGIQERYASRAAYQGVKDPTLTAEPAIDKTYQKAMELQEKIGPYKPPAERGGITGKIYGTAAKILGSGNVPAAEAAPTKESSSAPVKKAPESKFRATGAKVSADQLAQYALREKTSIANARKHLESLGYVVGN